MSKPQSPAKELVPSFLLDPGDIDLADDLAEEAEVVLHNSSSSDTLSATPKMIKSPKTAKQSMANILEAASKAVQEKTDLAYKGCDLFFAAQ